MVKEDTAPLAPKFEMDRAKAVPALIGKHEDFLIVSGLAGTSKDMASLTGDAANLFTMAGAMGASTAMGLGLALAQPDRRVLVITGDGELLMNIGTLATIAVLNPSRPQEVQFDEHKLIIVYGSPLERFEHLFELSDVGCDDQMQFITEAEHVHSSSDEYHEQFEELKMRLGMDGSDGEEAYG